MSTLQQRTWAEINLDNIEHNYKVIRNHIGKKVRFLGVVKANAYGHGSVPVAQVLQELDCEYLATATIEEAILLRENGITTPILILGYTSPAYTADLIHYGITQTIADLHTAQEMSQICSQVKKKLKVHLKADSGMGRLGFICRNGKDPSEDMLAVMKLSGLDVEGIFTHFAVSEVLDDAYTQTQYQDFSDFCNKLEEKYGQKFAIRHCANSGAMLNYNQMHGDMVRPGIALYGYPPGPGLCDIGLRPVMGLKTRIVHIKELSPGDSVSYGRKFRATEARKIAVLSIGYADGLHRVLSNQCEFLLHGKRIAQLGNICMDMCMADITNVPDAEIGDPVTIFGTDSGISITADELADLAGTISYELLCAVSPRVPRVYYRNGTLL